jgi:putative NADPH-quinone reductase
MTTWSPAETITVISAAAAGVVSIISAWGAIEAKIEAARATARSEEQGKRLEAQSVSNRETRNHVLEFAANQIPAAVVTDTITSVATAAAKQVAADVASAAPAVLAAVPAVVADVVAGDTDAAGDVDSLRRRAETAEATIAQMRAWWNGSPVAASQSVSAGVGE